MRELPQVCSADTWDEITKFARPYFSPKSFRVGRADRILVGRRSLAERVFWNRPLGQARRITTTLGKSRPCPSLFQPQIFRGQFAEHVFGARNAVGDLEERGSAKFNHAVFYGGFLDFFRRQLVENHSPQLSIER